MSIYFMSLLMIMPILASRSVEQIESFRLRGLGVRSAT